MNLNKLLIILSTFIFLNCGVSNDPTLNIKTGDKVELIRNSKLDTFNVTGTWHDKVNTYIDLAKFEKDGTLVGLSKSLKDVKKL